MDKPCLNCTKCQDPKNCENKHCSEWKRWFLGKWGQFNRFWKRYGESGGKDGKKAD